MSGRVVSRRAAAGLAVVVLLSAPACGRSGPSDEGTGDAAPAGAAGGSAGSLAHQPSAAGRGDRDGTGRDGNGGNEISGDETGGSETGGGQAGGDDDRAGAYLVARASDASLGVYDQPADLAGPILTLASPTASGSPLVLLVTERHDGWLKVLLPIRPNGSSGWVREADVALSAHRWHIEVRLSTHELVVRHGEEIWMLEPIAVGHRPTPTPGGMFYLVELLQPPEPDGPYGPYAFGLSGFSEVLTSFGGGDGRLGLHGTDDPASLGGDVTNGCIRLANEAITQLARTVPLGTPLTIQA